MHVLFAYVVIFSLYLDLALSTVVLVALVYYVAKDYLKDREKNTSYSRREV